MGKNTDRVKTRYNNEELSEFQKIIEEKLVEAKKQLDFYKNQLSEMANNPDTKVKRLSPMDLRMQKHILHLENAKLRIQNRVYGICRVTGKLIAKERLVAVPHATLSMEAKEKRK